MQQILRNIKNKNGKDGGLCLRKTHMTSVEEINKNAKDLIISTMYRPLAGRNKTF